MTPPPPSPLTAGESLALLLARRDAIARGDSAGALALRNALVDGSVGLVKYLAGKFVNSRNALGRSCLPLDDLIQEGYLAAIEAAENCEPSESVSWATYAGRAIRNRLIAANIEQVGAIRVPKDAVRAKKPRGYTDEGWRDINDAAAAARNAGTIDGAGDVEEDDGGSGRDVEAVESAVSGLPARQSLAIRLLFGLGGERAVEQAEAAERLGVSRRTLNRDRASALRKLAEDGLGAMERKGA